VSETVYIETSILGHLTASHLYLKAEQQRYNLVFETGLQFLQDYEYLINHPIATNALLFRYTLDLISPPISGYLTTSSFFY